MRERDFEAKRNTDPKLVQAFLELNGGRPPDDWIETSEGGAVDSEIWSRETPEQRQGLRDRLDKRLAELNPNVLDENGRLRWD